MIRPEEFNSYAELIIPLLGKRKPPETVFAEMQKIFSTYLPCSKCNEVKPADQFHRSSTFRRRGGRMPMCKACVKLGYIPEAKKND